MVIYTKSEMMQDSMFLKTSCSLFLVPGISEGEVRIDVGHCRQKCVIPVVEPLKREEFDKYLKKFPDMDPIQVCHQYLRFL